MQTGLRAEEDICILCLVEHMMENLRLHTTEQKIIASFDFNKNFVVKYFICPFFS